MKSRFLILPLACIIAFIGGSALDAKDLNNKNPDGNGKNNNEKLEVELRGSATGGTEKENAQLLEALKNLLKGLADKNLDEIGSCLSDHVTTRDAKSKDYLYGKEAVLAHLKKNVLDAADDKQVKRIVVYNPFVAVKGDTAMVSFRATKEFVKADAKKMESWCSEVFELKNGNWLVLHLKTNWELANTKD